MKQAWFLFLGAGLLWGSAIAHADQPRQFNFENDIVPILTRFGCNASACHGKAEGQNGFRLSVFGFDPAGDYAALTMEGRGRRTMPALPERNLVLAKAAGSVPHGGGVRIARNSDHYRTLRDWIVAGLPFGSPQDPRVVSIAVTPAEGELASGSTQRLQVTATYSDGRTADVTRCARFQTNDEGTAKVDETGLVTAGEVPGDVAIMASYLSQVEVFRAVVPRNGPLEGGGEVSENNFIDGLVYAKLRKLRILPSAPASDADFLRRVYLDVIGTLPSAEEARVFLTDEGPDRRARLVEALLKRPEFADFWALKFSDVLRVDRLLLGHKRAYAFYAWIRDRITANVPYDRFCREIVAAEGPIAENPPASFYKAVTKPGEMAGTLSQVFLGVRIECAECHHHPYDRWGQADYLGMQAFFTQVTFKGTPIGESLVAGPAAATIHPRSGEPVFARALGTEMPDREPAGDRRRRLAAWMTSRDNPWFARNFVNRVWAHFLGRGLVEPVDDFRRTNPPTNPELLDALARSFAEADFDLRQLIRTVTSSRVYQTSAVPNPTNERDDRNYSRALLKPLEAEVLLDAICRVTDVPEKFDAVPLEPRAVQLWDSDTPHHFLKLFGRPTRATPCQCERVKEPSVAQVLHLLNAPELHEKLSHAGGRIARWSGDLPDDALLTDELYLTFYSRFPSEQERRTALKYLKTHAAHRRQAIEDIAWSLLNTAEFLFNH